MLDKFIPAIATIGGGLLNQWSQDAQRSKNEALQREFAQNSIQWKVEDAKKAGIHPLYALGTPSFSPAVSVQGSPMGSAISSMGQDISRAMNATRSGEDRNAAFNTTVQQMSLQRMGLENELLASQIARLRDNTNPPMPTGAGVVAGKRGGNQGGIDPFNIGQEEQFQERPRLALGRGNVLTDPTVANAEEFEKRYGDDGPVSWYVNAEIGWRDLIANYGQPATWPRQLVAQVYDRMRQEVRDEYANVQRFAHEARARGRYNAGKVGR